MKGDIIRNVRMFFSLTTMDENDNDDAGVENDAKTLDDPHEPFKGGPGLDRSKWDCQDTSL